MQLSLFEYSIEHIDGTANIFADLLTRWSHGHRVQMITEPRICIITLAADKLVPAAKEISWPAEEILIESQQRSSHSLKNSISNTGGFVRLDERI